MLFTLLYAVGLAVLARSRDFDLIGAILQLGLFGVAFPLLVWALTPRGTPAIEAARSTTVETLVLAVHLIALSIYLIGGPQLIDRCLPPAWVEMPRIHFFVSIAKKLIVFVALPFLIFRAFFGRRWNRYGATAATFRELPRRWWLLFVLTAVLVLFQYFFGGGAAPIRAGSFPAGELAIGLPLCFVWLAVEAGLVEEFFFRALVQSQLRSRFGSEVTAVPLMALIFGLAHAPGFIYRRSGEMEGLGSDPTALTAIAYSIVVLAPAGILFGVIWARTRNLFVAIVIHAAVDLLPNFPGFAQLWGF